MSNAAAWVYGELSSETGADLPEWREDSAATSDVTSMVDGGDASADVDGRPPFDGSSARCLEASGNAFYIVDYPGSATDIEVGGSAAWSGYMLDDRSSMAVDAREPGHGKSANLRFRTGRIDQPITVRRYDDVVDYPPPRDGIPSLQVSGGTGAACSDVHGWIDVEEFSASEAGLVTTFTASFAFQCGDRSYVRGCVHYVRP